MADNIGNKAAHDYHLDVRVAQEGCYVKGAAAVLDKLTSALGIQPEECTPDGKFSLTACRCIGACGLAPVLTVNEDVYGRLVPEDVDKILAKYTA